MVVGGRVCDGQVILHFALSRNRVGVRLRAWRLSYLLRVGKDGLNDGF